MDIHPQNDTLNVPQNMLDIVADKVNAATHKITADLTRNHGVVHGWTLSYEDIAMVCQNAYCFQEYFIFPPTKIDPNSSHVTITREENPLVFSHIVNTYTRKWDQRALGILEQTGTAHLTKGMYDEYIEALRLSSSLMYKNPEVFLNEATDVVSWLAYYNQMNLGHIPFMPNAPMLSIQDITEKEISINYLRKNIHIPLETGSTVYVAWAGISSVLNLFNIPKHTSHRVLLNDKQPFIAGVLKKVAWYLGANHVSTFSGDFTNIQATDNSVGIMILSLVHAAGYENIDSLAKHAHQKMTEHGKVVIFTPIKPPFDGDISSEQMAECFLKNGFRKLQGNIITYELLWKPQWREETIGMLTKKTSQEIITILSDKLSEPKTIHKTQGEFMVFAVVKR